MKKWINAWSLVGFLLLVTAQPPLWGLVLERPDIWWTPADLAVPLEQGRDRVEVLAAGRLLDKRLAAGEIMLKPATGDPRPLRLDEVGLRFNNWDRVRAEAYWQGMLWAAQGAAGLVLLLLGLFLRPRRDKAEGRA